MRIGIMTGGGDAPGLNGIIESASRILLSQSVEVLGIADGFDGIFENRVKPITIDAVRGLHSLAGTFLGTSNRTLINGREQLFIQKYQALKLDGLIAAGGDGTFASLSRIGGGIPIIGVPKTIDNDLQGTEITFGYDTACAVVAEAVDSLRATAEAHKRIMVVEAMGRTAGWIALGGGLAGYADVILIPERPFKKDDLLDFARSKKAAGVRGLVVVVCESAHSEGEDPEVAFKVAGSAVQERYGGIAVKLARWLEAETGWEGRHIVLGHLQRSHAPTITDRFLTTAMGAEAAWMALQGAWNQAVVYRGGKVVRAPLSDIQGVARVIPANHRWISLAQGLGIFI